MNQGSGRAVLNLTSVGVHFSVLSRDENDGQCAEAAAFEVSVPLRLTVANIERCRPERVARFSRHLRHSRHGLLVLLDLLNVFLQFGNAALPAERFQLGERASGLVERVKRGFRISSSAYDALDGSSRGKRVPRSGPPSRCPAASTSCRTAASPARRTGTAPRTRRRSPTHKFSNPGMQFELCQTLRFRFDR